MTTMHNENKSPGCIDKRQILKAFNDHFIDFFEDVERVFPDNKDVSSAKQVVLGIRKMNPRLLMTVFHNSVGKLYRDEIGSGNLQYFTVKDYTPELQQRDNSGILIQKIDALREPVNNMSDDDQTKVITYLNNLICLSDMFYENI